MGAKYPWNEICLHLVNKIYNQHRLLPKLSFFFKGKHRNFEDTKGGKCLKNYFQDVLLIIVYHYPFYQTIPLLMSNYQDAFPHIIVCGPRESSRFQILKVDFGPRGYFSYECLGKAIRLHPDFRGYLFINDDMIVNWWNFAKLDKDKIWQGAQINYDIAHELGRRPFPDDWMWWKNQNGSVNCENAYVKVTSLIANSSSLDVDIQKLLEIHFRNGRNKTMCFRTWSDFVYVPGKFSREFELLCRIFFENKVFLEIAFPTIISFLDDWDAWEKVYGIYLPEVYGFQDFSNVKYVWPKFSKNVPFLHPVKFFGDKGLRNIKLFKSRVTIYGNLFKSC